MNEMLALGCRTSATADATQTVHKCTTHRGLLSGLTSVASVEIGAGLTVGTYAVERISHGRVIYDQQTRSQMNARVLI